MDQFAPLKLINDANVAIAKRCFNIPRAIAIEQEGKDLIEILQPLQYFYLLTAMLHA